jgi:hypothetical protein
MTILAIGYWLLATSKRQVARSLSPETFSFKNYLVVNKPKSISFVSVFTQLIVIHQP